MDARKMDTSKVLYSLLGADGVVGGGLCVLLSEPSVFKLRFCAVYAADKFPKLLVIVGDAGAGLLHSAFFLSAEVRLKYFGLGA